VQPGQKPEAAEQALIAEFEKLKREPVTATELQRAKNQFARDYIVGRESNQDKALHLAHAAVIHNDITTADGEFDIFTDITTADVQRVAKTYFNEDQPHGPLHPAEGRRVSVSWLMRIWMPGVALCLSVGRARVVGGHRRRTRPNSFRTGRPERPPLPLPGARGEVPALRDPHARQRHAGARDPAPRAARGHDAADRRRRRGRGSAGQGRAGELAGATCSTRAPATRSAQEIADQIDTIGGALGTGSGSDLSFANIVVMKDSFGTGMGLLADVVRNPKFDAEEIDRQKQQAISSLQVSATDPDFVASSLIDRLIYGLHPYGLPGNGTPETLAGHHPRRSGGVPQALLRAQQHDPGGGRRHHHRRGVRDGREGLRRLAARRADDRQSRSTRRRPRGASWWWTSPTRCRPRFASASSPSRATTATTWPGTWR
jgi:zinc protease